MIKVNLMGGLGNQMFQYAYARLLSEMYADKKIEVNPHFTFYSNLFVSKKIKMTNNSLNHLTLNGDVKEATRIKGLVYGFWRCVDYVLNASSVRKNVVTQSEFEKKARKGIYQMFAFTYYKIPKETKNKKYVTGYFSNAKYYENMREILLKEFQVKTLPSDENNKKIEEIKACNAVCVHIRRGDYTSEQFSAFSVCTEKYYQNGMNYIEQHVENPVFYVFSNTTKEIEWIKKNYHFKQEVKYVELNNPDYEELRLMYNCKHFIMSNSTFSWWGSFLSTNKDKIVIAPDRWLQEGFWEDPSGIYRDDMIKMNIE